MNEIPKIEPPPFERHFKDGTIYVVDLLTGSWRRKTPKVMSKVAYHRFNVKQRKNK